MLRYLKNSLIVLGALFIIYTLGKDWLYQRKGRQEVHFIKANKECFKGGEHWRYCVYTTDNHQDDVYLYVLHGKDMSEEYWNDSSQYPAQIQKYWQEQSMRPPKVITISYGPLWFITPKMTKKDTGLLENFRNEVFQTIEKRLGEPKYRMLVGDSMGGINTLTLTFYMGELFQRVAVLCPPLYDLSPFSSWSDIWEFIKKTGARPKSMMTVFTVARVLFTNDDEWKKFSSIELMRQADAKKLPTMYVSSGLYDEFGNYDGVLELVSEAQKKGVNLQWRPLFGGHCAADIPSLAEFLTPN